MVLGNIISAAFVRQMEHDADRYEVLVCGERHLRENSHAFCGSYRSQPAI